MREDKINGYELSRQWFNFIHETSEMISPIHTALYFWIVELNNQLQWKPVFGLPTNYSMQSAGVKTYKAYKKALDDLIRWGFVELIQKSYNQHTCNQVALVLKTKANDNPDELLSTLEPKQDQSTDQCFSLKDQSGTTIVKHIKTLKTVKTKKPDKPAPVKVDFIDSIITEFQLVFPDYVITTPGKEKKAAGTLLSTFKKQYPDLGGEEMLKTLHGYFERCSGIKDKYLHDHMSLSTMVSQYNAINKKLGKGLTGSLEHKNYDDKL